MRAVKVISFLVFVLSFFFAAGEAASQMLPNVQIPGVKQDTSSGRSYTSRQGGGQTNTSQPDPAQQADPSGPVPGVVDVFKKAGGFFGK